jgi:hypothetical protein
MSLHATAREANITDSIKKYFIDNLETIEGLAVTFDKALSNPKLQGRAVDRWVSIAMGPITIDTIATVHFDIYCCTREDNEGFKLAQLRDKVEGYLTNDGSPGDGKVNIPLYQSHAIDPWTFLGGMLIVDVISSGKLDAPDETKYRILGVRLLFAVQV